MRTSLLRLTGSRTFWEAALIGVTALWGWSFVAIHAALETLSDSAFNAYRFLIAAIAMVPLVLLQRVRLSKVDVLQGILAGFALYLAFLFQTKGLNYTSPSNAAFITGLAVVFTPAFLFVLFHTKPERKKLIGIVLATVGLAFLTLKNLNIKIGDLLVLMCAASFAFHIVLLSKSSKVTNTLNISFIQILVVGTLSLSQAFIFHEFEVPTSPSIINGILVIAILGTAIGFYVQTRAQVGSSPDRIALIIVLEPIFGGFFGYVLGGDRLSLINWVGAALIVLGMIVTEIKPSDTKLKIPKSV